MKKLTKNDVIKAIADSGVYGATTHELAETLGTSESNIRNHMSRLCKNNMVSKKQRRSGQYWVSVYYSNTAEEPVEQPVNVRIDDPAPEVSKHKPNQNHEGYNDPTATEAIKRMERHGGFMPGGIYKTTNGEAFLVLTTYPDTILGYRIDFVPKATDTDSEVTWKVGPNSALVHTHRVCSIPFKRLLLGNMTKCPFESFRDILRKSPFNQCKKVEVPVDNGIDLDKFEATQRELDDTKARCDGLLLELEDERLNVSKLNDEILRWEKAQESWRIEEKDLISRINRVCDPWHDLAKALDTEFTSIVNVSELIDRAKKYKELAEAPIDKDALGVSVADYERLKGERDVYKSIVDRVVDYWAS